MSIFQPLSSDPVSTATSSPKPCRHPRVRIVSREEDAEFVECEECGDIFDSSEFKDMAIEESAEPEL